MSKLVRRIGNFKLKRDYVYYLKKDFMGLFQKDELVVLKMDDCSDSPLFISAIDYNGIFSPEVSLKTIKSKGQKAYIDIAVLEPYCSFKKFRKFVEAEENKVFKKGVGFIEQEEE